MLRVTSALRKSLGLVKAGLSLSKITSDIRDLRKKESATRSDIFMQPCRKEIPAASVET